MLRSPLHEWRVCVFSHSGAAAHIIQLKLSAHAVGASDFVGCTSSCFLPHFRYAVVADVVSAAIRGQNMIKVAQANRAAELEVLWTILILALDLLTCN